MLEVHRFVSKRGYARMNDYTPETDALDGLSVIPLAELQSRSASLVLGEPGAGKSTALKRMRESLSETGLHAQLIDLRQCFSDSSLENAFDQVRSPDNEVDVRRILLIDSIDEAPGLIRNYIPFLEQRISDLIDNGWSVVGACRTAESVRALDELFEGFQEEAVHVLLPLRRSDVTAIADSEGIEASVFLEQVARMRLDSLAAVPFTLNLLCRIYQADARFPDSRVDVFERAVNLIMAGDAVDGYTPVQATDIEPIRQRLSAERLAGFAAFADVGGYGLFRMGEMSSGLPTETLIGQESSGGVVFDLENKDFQQLLKTPLFADSGANERQFAHRRLRDFLAAQFMHRQSFGRSQLESILLVSDGGVSIPPQMVDVATWLVSFSTDEYEWIVSADPLSLVRNRLGDDVPQLAPRLVDYLIERASAVDRILSWRDDLSGLEHRNLSDQLRIALDGSEPQQTVSLRILKDAYVDGLEELLLSVVNDQTRSTRVRELAIEVMSERGLDDQLANVQLLGDGFFESDGNAELRGAALQALWPRHLQKDQLLQLLIRPPEFFFGNYYIALQRIEETMTPELAVTLLESNAAIETANGRPRIRGLKSLVDKAVELSIEWPDLDQNGVRSLAQVISRRLERDRPKLPFSLDKVSHERFEEVVAEIVAGTSGDAFAGFALWLATDVEGTRLLSRTDVPWMAARALGASDSVQRNIWTNLIDRFLDSIDSDDLQWAWAQKDGPLWAAFRYRFDAIDLNSEEASRARESWRRMNRDVDDEPDERGMSAEEYVATVRRLMSTARSNPHAFWDFSRWLDVNLGARRYNYGHNADLLSLPNVEVLGASAHAEILDLAIAYVTSSPPLPARLKPNTMYHQMRAVYQALFTLETHNPVALDQVPADEWVRLVPAVLEFPVTNDDTEERSVRVRLLARAAAANRDGFTRAVRRYLRRIADGHGQWTSITGLRGFVDPSAIRSLRESVRSSRNPDRYAAFQLYLDTDSVGAAKWAISRIVGKSDDADEISVLLGLLLDNDPNLGFPLIQRLVVRGPELAVPALLEIARRERYGQGRIHEVDPRIRTKIFEILTELFPPADETFETGVHAVTSREDLADWRQGILNGVIQGGTREGLLALIDLSHRRPDLDLDWAVVAAKESYRINGWFPLTTSELRTVLEQNGAQLARSNSDLLALTLAALNEIQAWLTGETPQAFALWDVGPRYRSPKDENRVSDWYCHALRTILDRSGLIINREVEVKNISGKGVGHRQDIRIEVRDQVSGEHYVTVVEVKGIWNAGVKSNLQTQLVGDYLIGGGLTHGIYLVCLFSPSEMQGVDSKARLSKSNRRGLAETLRTQAAAAAPAVTVVPVLHVADMPRRN